MAPFMLASTGMRLRLTDAARTTKKKKEKKKINRRIQANKIRNDQYG
ncbi:hypothetical protein QG37_04604 [Candidozyma auris]|uniref:Uncharacterized protein n=1 Tax=Candidozyma auris TaxID=498019 RepID=A0A0L0NXH0_CANAR|nr:hypothetical protein QG37_04604 [[Candida] auris]